ncbi:MAG: glycerol-3-phosphate dehydrogenase [Polyangiaceae bacterium]
MARSMDVAVVGGGEWGRALAAAAARNGSRVTLISRRDAGAPEGVVATTELKRAADASMIVLAVPSPLVREYAGLLGTHLDGSHFIVHGIRGLVGPELMTVSELLRAETPARRVGALGGPALANELLEGAASVIVVGSQFAEVRNTFRDFFQSGSLRVYTTADRVGLEWASALVGCLAIALGYARGSGQRPGLIAAFTTRAVHEIARIAEAAGGEHETLLGLAGLGDLLAAVGQQGRPEVIFGQSLAEGVGLEEAKARAGQRLEALDLLPRVLAWIQQEKLRAPILTALSRFFEGGHSTEEIVDGLMREPMVE